MPVFALGRAQELLLVLDEYWAAHPELNGIPIYYISNLAAKCMRVYQTFIHGMNDNIKRKFARGVNPWTFYREGKGIFKKGYVTNLRGLDKFDDRGPCVRILVWDPLDPRADRRSPGRHGFARLHAKRRQSRPA